ncbi:DUF4158 domain-containing protein [Nonomuraea sp. 3-1Str]|uniref:DUF4158 domain-containing protein n=1 Tax=Nonomuraea sp. 3-1Str TaxID=2929801 RepID=UPI0037C9032D
MRRLASGTGPRAGNRPSECGGTKRLFFLDNADKSLIRKKRGPHHRLGYAVQLTSVRYIGWFWRIRSTGCQAR